MALVKVNAPRRFTLNGEDGAQVHVPAGISKLDEELTKHWYFEANGAQVLGPAGADEPEQEDEADLKAQVERLSAELVKEREISEQLRARLTEALAGKTEDGGEKKPDPKPAKEAKPAAKDSKAGPAQPWQK